MPRVNLTQPIIKIKVKTPPAIIQRDTSRAEEVIHKIVSMSAEHTRNEFEMFDLWAEVVDGDYFHADHCQTLEEFLKKHGIDLSPREVTYRVKVSKYSKRLGISHEDLIKAKISKVKAIFELNPDVEYNTVENNVDVVKSGEQLMKDMVAAAVGGAKLADLKKEVAGLLGKEEKLAHETITYTVAQKEIVDRTVDLIRIKHGTTIDPVSGAEVELSRAACYEEMAVEYWNDPNNRGEEVGTPGDFQDEAYQQGEDGRLFEQAD